MSDDTYEGWANRETWACNLWLSNDEGLYRTALDIVADVAPIAATASALAVGEALVAMLRDLDIPGVNRDVGSWWRIDEREIGEAWIATLEDVR